MDRRTRGTTPHHEKLHQRRLAQHLVPRLRRLHTNRALRRRYRPLCTATADAVTTIMCAEAVAWRCHRSLIGDALLVHGYQVLDIMSPPQPHHTPAHPSRRSTRNASGTHPIPQNSPYSDVRCRAEPPSPPTRKLLGVPLPRILRGTGTVYASGRINLPCLNRATEVREALPDEESPAAKPIYLTGKLLCANRVGVSHCGMQHVSHVTCWHDPPIRKHRCSDGRDSNGPTAHPPP